MSHHETRGLCSLRCRRHSSPLSLANMEATLTPDDCFVKRLCLSNADGSDDCPRQQQQARLETRQQLRKQARVFRILLCLQLSCSPIINMQLSSCSGHVIFSFVKTATPATRGGRAATKKTQQQFQPWGDSPERTGLCTLSGRNNQTQCYLSITVNNASLVSTAAAKTSVVPRRLPSPWRFCLPPFSSHPTAINRPHRRAKTSNGWSAVRLPAPIPGSSPSCFSVHKRPYKPECPPSLLFRSHSPLKKNARSAARHNPVL